MKTIGLLASCLLAVCWPGGPYAQNVARMSVKGTDHVHGVIRGGPRLPGDTVQDPLPVGDLPFSTAGNTCSFADDYDEACPWPDSTSPDVVYLLVPDRPLLVDIDLCASAYDTKVFVYEDQVQPGQPFACNDDACGMDGYRSRIDQLSLRTQHSYFIVIDGYGGDCGDFHLEITETEPCLPYCPPGVPLEGEPLCHDDYEDNFNGGCCCDSLAFSYLYPQPGTIRRCGTSGTFLLLGGLHMREDDWYQIELEEPRTITYCVTGEYQASAAVIDGRDGCAGMEILAFESAGTCEPACIEIDLEPGIYWLWTGPSVFWGVPCGSLYLLTVDGFFPAPSGTEDGDTWLPTETRLHACFPNPFNPQTTIQYDLPRPGAVALQIFDLAGKVVRTLRSGSVEPAGRHEAVWDGRDDRGQVLASGIYFCRLATAGRVRTERLVLVR